MMNEEAAGSEAVVNVFFDSS